MQRASILCFYVFIILHIIVRKEQCVYHVVKITCMWLLLNSDPKLEAQRQRLSSVVAADLLPSLEGVELGAYGKVSVHLLIPFCDEKQKTQKYTRHLHKWAWFKALSLFFFLITVGLSSSDGVIRSVPLSNQCFGEAEERWGTRNLHSSDPSVRSPWQRAEELHPCSSDQQCGTGPLYDSNYILQTHTCFSSL